jgi:hypothetical protein
MASENERTYSDREFALILNRAAELDPSVESRARGRADLSLDEIKAIAVEAGFDPQLIERAARQLPTNPGASALERMIGGPLKHEFSTRFSAPLTEEQSAHLLALVRAAADQQGAGDSAAGGLTWNSVGEGSHVFVAAHREGDGTRVRIVVNRYGVLAMTGVVSLTAGLILPLIVASTLDLDSAAINSAIFTGGLAGSVTIARAVWSATSKRLREQASALMDVFAGTLDQSAVSESPEASPSSKADLALGAGTDEARKSQ